MDCVFKEHADCEEGHLLTAFLTPSEMPRGRDTGSGHFPVGWPEPRATLEEWQGVAWWDSTGGLA